MTKKLVSQLAALTCFIGSAAQADQVIVDDLIVSKASNGLICVGEDCANGEDTLDNDGSVLELKDIRTMIHFNDTSGGSFPTADWVLRANDTFEFEESRFMLQTITGGVSKTITSVHADAPKNALVISDTGRVGMGTEMPDANLHIAGIGGAVIVYEQTNSGNQTWGSGANGLFYFIEDSTANTVPFIVLEEAESFSFVVGGNGNIGMGTFSPEAPLELSSSDSFNFFRITALGAVNDSVDITYTGGPLGTGQLRYNIVDGDNQEMSLDADGNMILDGTLTTAGPTCAGGCDRVFDADYPLPVIAERAELMFAAGHLPAIGPTAPDAPVNVSETLGNVINELEHAHIFIAQQNELIQRQEQVLADVLARLSALEAQ